MLDRGEFRKRLLLRLLTHPLTVGPVVVGVSLLLAAWAFGVKIGLALFIALACVLGAFGVFFTRLISGSEKISEAVIDDMQKEAHGEREKALDTLDRELTEDGDPRTEACLRDLRALAKAFRSASKPSVDMKIHDAFSIAAGVEELFTRSVASLKKTLDLWRTAESMSTKEAREPVLAQREKMIADVTESIRQLGKVLAGIEALKAGESVQSDLARIRGELDQRLAVAKKVEERMRSLEKQIEPSDAEPEG